MKTLVRIVIVLVVLAGAGIGAWLTLGARQAPEPPATAPVERGDVEQTVLASGTLQASSVTSVGAPVSGRIETLHVKLGDTVEKGAPIADLDSLEQENKVKSAEASLANMTAQRKAREADVASAEQALQRATQLQSKKLISDADFVAAQTALDSAKAQIEALDAQISQAELAVESAKLDLIRTRITAPVSGTIVAVLVTEGQSVNAAQQSPTIVKIADLDTMLIKALISEADVTRVQPGQHAYFSILGEPNARIDAVLKSIEPAPDAIVTDDSGIAGNDNAVYYNGLFEVANPDHRLRIAMTAQVTIVVQSAHDVLLVPAGALNGPTRDGSYMVAVYDPGSGTVSPRPVKVGINNNIVAEVIEGLEEGQLVVTSGRPRGQGAPGAGNGGGVRFPGAGGGVVFRRGG